MARKWHLGGDVVFDHVRKVSFETSDGSLGADCPSFFTVKTGGVEI
jgi:hypothetical protein